MSPAARHPRTHTLEEVQHLLAFGDKPAQVVLRLGMSAQAIARALYRCDRPDLARRFEQLRDRRHPCVDCGRPVMDPRAPRCRADGHRYRVATHYRATA